MNWGNFGRLLLQFLPVGLKAAGVPDEMNQAITEAALEAEQIHGAGNGPAKLAHVQTIADDALNITNQIRIGKGKDPIDMTTVHDAIAAGLGAGIKAAKAIDAIKNPADPVV